MRIVVTGGAGFIGSHIVDAYCAAGHDVLVIDDLSTGRRDRIPAGAQFIQCTVEHPDVVEHIAQFRPDVINHHAAQVDLQRSSQIPSADALVNIIGTTRIIEGALRAGTSRLIFASSAAVYGTQQIFPAPVTHPLQPETPYGIGKMAGEHYVQWAARQHGWTAVILRYANVYGPRQTPKGEAGVVAVFVEQLRGGGPLRIHGDGRQTRDFVYVGDVAAANVAALQAESGVYHVATGIETSVLELAQLMRQQGGTEVAIVTVPQQTGGVERSQLEPGPWPGQLTSITYGLAELWKGQ